MARKKKKTLEDHLVPFVIFAATAVLSNILERHLANRANDFITRARQRHKQRHDYIPFDEV